MRLRNEISELFGLAGIDHSSLLTVGECVNELKLARERVSLHLVDHNILSPEFCGFEDVYIIFLNLFRESLRSSIIVRTRDFILTLREV